MATVESGKRARRDSAARGAVAFALAAVLAAALAGCGGGGGSSGGGNSSGSGTSDITAGLPDGPGCTQLDRRLFLSEQFRTQYFYNDLTPGVDPQPEQLMATYFKASLFKGNETIPADRFSGYQTTEAYNQFYGEGKTLAYGLAVAGQEVQGKPDQPLWVRDVTPGSPAGLADVRRGDRVRRLNGVAAEDAVLRSDFSALTASKAGSELELELERAGDVRTIRLTANVHDAVSVRLGRVLSLPDGRKMGLVRFNSMITLAEPEIQAYFGQFRDQGVSDVIFDLRYNGGGSVAVGGRIASLAAGIKANNLIYAVLRNNAQLQASNTTYRFGSPLFWSGVNRVYVLTGSRTCSASEQIIAGLRGVGVEVVQIGATTCGKPVGFRPRDHCGLTYSMVNFDSVNARGEGGYYSGFSATCRVAEDFTKSMEDPTEPLTAAAMRHAQGLGCPPVSGVDQVPLLQRGQLGLREAAVVDGPEVPGVMVP